MAVIDTMLADGHASLAGLGEGGPLLKSSKRCQDFVGSLPTHINRPGQKVHGAARKLFFAEAVQWLGRAPYRERFAASPEGSPCILS